MTGEAAGRGAAYFLDGLDGRPWVLRHNRRGGAIAHINHDRFLWSGAARARSLTELSLLADMRAAGLPVPAPVAALADRRGLVYRGDVITERIADSRPLAEHLMVAVLADSGWQALGRVIARFHRAGIHHADLNARNVLLDGTGQFYVIDFDKARQRRPGSWCAPNLARLRRSLDKFAGKTRGFAFSGADWAALERGYRHRMGEKRD
ncbi:3-deoxy-D-manno-octulosonic-acid kinase [Salinisphaera sp. T31B1]